MKALALLLVTVVLVACGERAAVAPVQRSPKPQQVTQPASPPAQASSFPDVKEWSTLRIKLQRTACFGACPVYQLEVTGDGHVTYCGTAFVRERGVRTRTISVNEVKAIVDKYRLADFLELNSEYAAEITDMPTTYISIAFDGRNKRVRDYMGGAVGMPEAVNELESAIDAAAGAEAWVGDVGSEVYLERSSPKCP